MRQISALLSILFFLSTNAQTTHYLSTPVKYVEEPRHKTEEENFREQKAADEQKPLAMVVPEEKKSEPTLNRKELKIVIVTWDGCRWQETFRGVSKSLQKRLAKDPKFDQSLYAKLTVKNREDRRKALMPFMWETIARQGILVGNKDKGNVLSVHNPYFFSYPGYSELFCGFVDKKVNSNDYTFNPNNNIFDFLLKDNYFKNSIAAFGNWDAFPKILNVNRNFIPTIHTYLTKCDSAYIPPKKCYDKFFTKSPVVSPYAEKDTAVYHFAKEYLVRNHPKALFIGFDETDHFGHSGNYPAYAMAAYQSDVWMQDLWNTIQSDPFYKDQTILFITCDHGRGPAIFNMWRHHGQGIVASRFTWFAAIGPGVKSVGEAKQKKRYHHDQIAATISKLLGKDFNSSNSRIGKPIDEVIEK